MQSQLWIEPVGKLIIARVRGLPTEPVLKEVQERIIRLVKETKQGRVLYDVLEMDVPSIEVVISQWQLDKGTEDIKLRRAIVVPNTQLAYLARLSFGDEDHRVFYNDLGAAIAWLESAE